uniref:Uncharacterized protein n=1 Tax=Setaria italica TaxID=4555 RepID=K4ANQ4_SETIT
MCLARVVNIVLLRQNRKYERLLQDYHKVLLQAACRSRLNTPPQ